MGLWASLMESNQEEKQRLYDKGRQDAKSGASAVCGIERGGDPARESQIRADYYLAGFLDEIADRIFSTSRRANIL